MKCSSEKNRRHSAAHVPPAESAGPHCDHDESHTCSVSSRNTRNISHLTLAKHFKASVIFSPIPTSIR